MGKELTNIRKSRIRPYTAASTYASTPIGKGLMELNKWEAWEDLRRAAEQARKEMTEIETLADELGGNPFKSSAYIYNEQVIRSINDLFSLRNRSFTFTFGTAPENVDASS